MTIDDDLSRLEERLAQGAREYGNKSLVRSPAAIVGELEQELIDLPGWTYILWAIANRKLVGGRPEAEMRDSFVWALRHRMHRNDRGTPNQAPGRSIEACMADLEILAMDMFAMADAVRKRLLPIARAMEVAAATNPNEGRRGSRRDPRSDD